MPIVTATNNSLASSKFPDIATVLTVATVVPINKKSGWQI